MKPHRLSHTSSMFETDTTFQDEMSRLKADADWNMPAIVVGTAVFQIMIFWLNADADWNAPSKFATLAVFQPAR